MSAILLKIVTGAIHLKNNVKEAKRVIEETEKELDGLGIVKPVHRKGHEGTLVVTKVGT